MRKYLFITMCAFLSLWAGKVSAQRYLPGQTGLELRLGGVDDFGKNVRHLRGNFQVGMALSRYNRNRSRWVVGADYVKKHYARRRPFPRSSSPRRRAVSSRSSRTGAGTCSSLPACLRWPAMRG